MKPNLKLFVSALAFTVLLTGCTYRLIDFTVISSKNVRLDLPDGASGPRTEGVHSVPVFFFALGRPNMKEATDRAIENAGPQYDALIDGVVTSNWWYFIYGVSSITVEGTPINTKMLANLPPGALDGRPILYHSSLGISNDEAIAAIGIVALEPSRQDSIRAGLVEDPPAQQ
ncbi:MAG: hypothetical protein IIA55_02255 [Gemmatimonadetes bacterium]|nr:hypothetical protein [Gemmatimonadota bacterium]